MFVAGYATDAEIAELEKRGWEVEDAAARGLVEPCNLSELSLAELETDKLMTAPETPGTKAVVIFNDASLFDVLNCAACCDGGTRRESRRKKWPEMPADEEFLRIILLQTRILGKDTTVEPYTSFRDELEWRRTDKHVLRVIDANKLSVETIAEMSRNLKAMKNVFADQEELMRSQMQRFCSHKYSDGSDASVGVPVSAERFCRTCGAQWD